MALTLEEVRRYSEELRTWNSWGEDNEIGTLNFVTPEKIVEAAKLITKARHLPWPSISMLPVRKRAAWVGSTPSTPCLLRGLTLPMGYRMR